MDTVRVMNFYDGGFFRQGNVYFRYKEERGWFSLPELHSLIEEYTASKVKASTDATKVVASHYYDGRPTSRASDEAQLEKDRDFELALIDAGITTHYLPLKETPRGDGNDINYRLMQKGVDVEMAIDVLDSAHEDRYDIAVLFTGDGDFVPLVKRITSLGKQVLIAYFDIDKWDGDDGSHHSATRASASLIDAANYSLNFNQLVEDRDWKPRVRNLFFMPGDA